MSEEAKPYHEQRYQKAFNGVTSTGGAASSFPAHSSLFRSILSTAAAPVLIADAIIIHTIWGKLQLTPNVHAACQIYM
jgi:hypothetical protein